MGTLVIVYMLFSSVRELDNQRNVVNVAIISWRVWRMIVLHKPSRGVSKNGGTLTNEGSNKHKVSVH